MKKTILTFFVASIMYAASAQIEQGTIMFGGSIGFQSESSKYEFPGSSFDLGKTTTIEFNPQVGFFIMDNLALGTGITLMSETFSPDGGGGDEKSNTFLLNPFARYYIGNLFGEGQVGFGSSKEEYDGEEFKLKIFGFGVGVGYAVFLNDNVAIEPKIGYRSFTLSDSDNSDVKLISSGLFINIGIQVYLR